MRNLKIYTPDEINELIIEGEIPRLVLNKVILSTDLFGMIISKCSVPIREHKQRDELMNKVQIALDVVVDSVRELRDGNLSEISERVFQLIIEGKTEDDIRYFMIKQILTNGT